MAAVQSEVAGSVWKVLVSVGQQVGPEDELVILESMKMEIPVQAGAAGVVDEILVAEQDAVAEGQVLVRLRP
ncbi:acetyl-CoA carboxylase biotin carboxyl carrier protein subunit [Verticiella sediminum]|uniref:Acetyl-CoA carboxylase biotin carboxyl carrier protein subunit n=1 Tax=Verticiella sediminum TaxID=1247510 RepID=A0A556AG99_9BURK|nr:acetyl-CoA carboxylase biotin carboxyl carrier protein subunit [Verticiella sediminum]